MGPYNQVPEPPAKKFDRIDDIGGPDTHSNFPWGWAMAANTPLKRYKQNTHGGGIRDPLVISWPKGLAARGELRHGFHHATDLVPTLLDLLAIPPPARLKGLDCLSLDGESFAADLHQAGATPRQRPQVFEMFGHRGLWQGGWKAVAYHPPGQPFDADVWELYHLDQDFAENHDLATQQPERLRALVDTWWLEARRCQVLPLDDRFAARFADNAHRVQGARHRFVMHAGMGHLPTDVAPDVRSRGYLIEADVRLTTAPGQGVLVAHGDATSGYSLYLQDGHLVHDLNIGGVHQLLRSDRPVPAGHHLLAMRLDQGPLVPVTLPVGATVMVPSYRRATLLIDGVPAGTKDHAHGFNSLISWSGLDIGMDRGSPVSHYAAPFEFNGRLRQVSITLDPPADLNGQAIGQAEMARQ
jgi:arylsulfatase